MLGYVARVVLALFGVGLVAISVTLLLLDLSVALDWVHISYLDHADGTPYVPTTADTLRGTLRLVTIAGVTAFGGVLAVRGATRGERRPSSLASQQPSAPPRVG